jgi:hypothetical protein
MSGKGATKASGQKATKTSSKKGMRRHIKKAPVKKATTAPTTLCENDAMKFYTALSSSTIGKQQLVRYLKMATNSSTRKQQLLKQVASVLLVKVGNKNKFGQRAAVGVGHSVRVYKFNPPEDVKGPSGIRTDGRLSGVPGQKGKLYTIKHPAPEGDETKDVPPGLYGRVLDVRHTQYKPKQVKVMMWFHKDKLCRRNDRTGMAEGQHARNVYTPLGDEPENFLTFIHVSTWLLPSQVHRFGISKLKKHVRGLLEKAQKKARGVSVEEPERGLLQCRPPTDEEEDYNWGAEQPEEPKGAEEPKGDVDESEETESDVDESEETSEDDEEEEDEEVED